MFAGWRALGCNSNNLPNFAEHVPREFRVHRNFYVMLVLDVTRSDSTRCLHENEWKTLIKAGPSTHLRGIDHGKLLSLTVLSGWLDDRQRFSFSEQDCWIGSVSVPEIESSHYRSSEILLRAARSRADDTRRNHEGIFGANKLEGQEKPSNPSS